MTVAVVTAWAQEHGSIPYYRRAPEATRTIVERAASVKPGDSKSMVLNRLGTPDHDIVLMRKERPEVIGRSMTYDIVKWKHNLVNEIYDQYVTIYLDPRDVVHKVIIRAELTGG
jgi:hypothetical protein